MLKLCFCTLSRNLQLFILYAKLKSTQFDVLSVPKVKCWPEGAFSRKRGILPKRILQETGSNYELQLQFPVIFYKKTLWSATSRASRRILALKGDKFLLLIEKNARQYKIPTNYSGSPVPKFLRRGQEDSADTTKRVWRRSFQFVIRAVNTSSKFSKFFQKFFQRLFFSSNYHGHCCFNLSWDKQKVI